MKPIVITPEILALLIELLKLDPLEEIKTINGRKVIVYYGS